MFVDPRGLYYIRQNSDDTYSAMKSHWWANAGKVAMTFVPYGDAISYTIEGLAGVTGGTSKTPELEVISGSLRTPIASSSQELSKKVGGKIAGVIQIYDTSKALYDISSVATLDKISFDLVGKAGISTSSSNQSNLESKFERTAVFIGMMSGYFTDSFQYGTYLSKTLYEIDTDLANAKDNKALSKKVNTYVVSYTSYLMNCGYSRAEAEGYGLNFKNWLNDSSNRRSALLNGYKEIINK